MLAFALRLLALVCLSIPASADAVMAAGADRLAPAAADDFEATAARRAEILASYTRLDACHDLLHDLYQWGVLDLAASGIAFGLINNATRVARRAQARGDHELRRAHGDFVIGFCTAAMHIHMANRDRAHGRPDPSARSQAIGPVLQSRIVRLQALDTFEPDRCRARIQELEEADVIDQVASAMLRSALDDAIAERTSAAPRPDPGQGIVGGLCSALLNAVLSAG